MKRSLPRSLLHVWALTYFYVILEWLFFVTKTSFLSKFSLFEQVLILLTAALPFLGAATLIYLGLLSLSKILPKKITEAVGSRGVLIEYGVSALLATTIVLLWFDNLAYELFSQGIVRTEGHQVFLCALVVFSSSYFIWRRISSGAIKSTHKWDKAATVVLATLTLSIALLVSLNLYRLNSNAKNSNFVAEKLPNILFFATDGLDADRLHLYGSKRKVTPNLDMLAEYSLVMQVAVSNSGKSTGSTTSMLTGALPTTNKVIFPPHALIGKDSFQHLPSILRSIGYSTVQEATRYYVDSADINMRDAFDSSNGREIEKFWASDLSVDAKSFLSPATMLFERLKKRAFDRYNHILGIKRMVPDYEVMMSPKIAKVYGISDKSRINRTIEFIKNTDKPFMAHVHLMGTHCCRFHPKKRFFSLKHKKLNKQNRLEFVDDTIMETDVLFGRLIDSLKSMGKFENTIIVYTSDHNLYWATGKKIPFLIKFPNSEFAGSINSTTQLLDVSPTLLDFVGIDKPSWMEGDSLIDKDKQIDPLRHIFTIDKIGTKRLRGAKQKLSVLVGSGAPTYGLNSMGLFVCNRRYLLEFESGEVVADELVGHPKPCNIEDLPTNAEAKKIILDHLSARSIYPPQKKVTL
jgi:arylsulfatase A-like enzyme